MRRIYLDCDGVLAKCHETALSVYGYHDEYSLLNNHVKGVIDANEATYRSMDRDVFWSLYDHDFWATLPLTEFCYPLIDLCRDLVGEDNVFVTTRATTNPECWSGKKEWADNNLPRWLRNQVIISGNQVCKSVLASPGSLLVDDSEFNCVQFAQIGQSVMVERPWNGHKHMEFTTLEYRIRQCLPTSLT